MMLNLTRFEEFVRSIAIDDGYAGWEYEDGESMVNDAVAWLAAHDALAAEVGRLRAQSTGEWRNPPTSPENDEWFEVRVRVRYLSDQNCYKTNFGDEIGIDAFEGWRPAPPQE